MAAPPIPAAEGFSRPFRPRQFSFIFPGPEDPGCDLAALQAAAGKAMAKNQGISVKAATGILSPVATLDPK